MQGVGRENVQEPNQFPVAPHPQGGRNTHVTVITCVYEVMFLLQIFARCPALRGKEAEVDKVLQNSLSEAKYYRKKKRRESPSAQEVLTLTGYLHLLMILVRMSFCFLG